MWIPERSRELADIDVSELAGRLAQLPEDLWLSDQAIQKKIAGDRATNSIFVLSLASADFEPLIARRPISASDVPRAAGWEVLHDLVEPFVEAAVSHFAPGGVVTRIQFARMPPGCEITPHVDISLILTATHRLHIPVITSPDVDFVVAREKVEMAAGKLYELNNRVEHSVLNRGTTARVHLIIDYLPPENNRPGIVSRNFEARNKQLATPELRPPVRRDVPLPKLIATSVVRGAHQNESHGGVYLVDMDSGQVEQVVDWNTVDIDWSGRGWDRGLRGIAFHGDRIYIAASDELYCFDRQFQVVASFRSPYLKHAHEIVRHDDHLLLTSTGFDSLLRFDLERQTFDRGWHLQPVAGRLTVTLFDPQQQRGPMPGNVLHLNHVFQDGSGIYVSGLKLPFLLHLNKGSINRYAPVPLGAHNARPHADGGVLYQDTAADMLVFRKGEAFASVDVPHYPEEALLNRNFGDEQLARQGFGRGLCVYRDDIVFAGSSPSTITAIDLRASAPIKSVNITMDIRNAIHGLEVWPFD